MGEEVRTLMWMTALAGCEGIEMQSTLSRIERTARTLSCRVLRIDGVFRRMLIPCEAATASIAGIAAENTKEVPLMRYWARRGRKVAYSPGR